MDQLVARAREAQKRWASMPIGKRIAVVRELRRRIGQRATDLASKVHFRQRRSLEETLVAEVLPLADACRFLERNAETVLKPRRFGRRGLPLWLTGIETTVYREPFGVVLIIGPSNYPLMLPGIQAMQALVAGNSVLLKPGLDGRNAAEALGALLRDAGGCDHCLTVLDESKAAVGTAIGAGVDKVVLTGSADTGQALLHQLASAITPSVMELSGCDAVFVCEDADLELVVKALRVGMTLNGGASCIAPRRVFAVGAVGDALEEQLVQAIDSTVQFRISAEIARKVTETVLEALAGGARVAVGDMPREGRMGPMVIGDARVEMNLLQEDIMAPLLALVRVDDEDHALQLSDRCPYALGATVFGPLDRAKSLARRINAGVVVINDMIIPTADPRMPFGARKRSGFGITRGESGLLEFTRVKAISVRRGGPMHHLDPYDSSDRRLFCAYIKAVHGGSLLNRGMATVELIRELARKRRNYSEKAVSLEPPGE